MTVALVHDWLTGMRGGERCLEVFCELFPTADVYTLLHVPGSVSPSIERHTIHTSLVQRLPLAQKNYRHLLPLFPLAIERFNLEGVDLILSSSHCVAKNVRVPTGSLHISYIHTPMRYVWDQYDSYFGRGRTSLPVRAAMRTLRPWLQRKDVAASTGVDFFIANSRHVAGRIRRYYDRPASVIYPPVNVDKFSLSKTDGGYYLMVTAFAPYKRADLAIQAFNALGLPLKIIGSGQAEHHLRKLAGSTIEFCGWQEDSAVREAYAGCRALVFPGEEDFGIVPVEAMASGKPVIAYGKGGALETVVPLPAGPARAPDEMFSFKNSPTGVFFYEQTVRSLVDAVGFFEKERHQFDPQSIQTHARRFDRERFSAEIHEFVTGKLSDFSG